MKKWLVGVLSALATVLAVLFLPLIPPAHSQTASLTLDWTAPGDDGNVGTASSYEMRYSTAKPDTTSITTMNSWWSAATVVSGMPVPLIAGTTQSVTVSPVGGFTGGQTYYFVMKACDEVPNCSPYSNVAVRAVADSLPPRRIVDLRVR